MIHRATTFILFLNSLFIPNGSSEEPCNPRPFYNMAHMTNSLHDLEAALHKGANAVEVDVHYLPNGTADRLYHGRPCDCLRHCEGQEEFGKYFDRVRELTTPSHPDYKKQFVFIFLDTKTTHLDQEVKYNAGQSMASQLVTHLWENGNGTSAVKIMLYVDQFREADVINGFRQYFVENGYSHLLTQIGYEIGPDSGHHADEFLKKVGVKERVWKGDGITNCLSFLWSNRLIKRFMRERDQGTSKVKKVYFWTVDLSNQIMDNIRLGVDGLMTNHPERIVSILDEPEFKCTVRLATNEDEPFERFISPENPNQHHHHHHRDSNTSRSSLEELTKSLFKFLRGPEAKDE